MDSRPPSTCTARNGRTEKYAPKVKSDFLGGVRSGVNGTPSFFINERQHEGAYEFSDLVSAIDSHLTA
jgi:protein-disulfide isomerase